MFSIENLSWLAGSWVAEHDGRVSEESWLSPLDGTMIGISRTSRDGRILFEEHMQIGVWKGVPSFVVVHKLGEPCEALELIEQTRDHSIFGDPDNPEAIRVGYYRTETGVEAKVFGTKNNRRLDLTFSFTRS